MNSLIRKIIPLLFPLLPALAAAAPLAIDLTTQVPSPEAPPVKDADFQMALGASGEVSKQLHRLLERHLLLQDFGAALSRMSITYFSEKRATDVDDVDRLRWGVRSDGTSGFLFYNNDQPYVPSPEKQGVQFQVKTAGGTFFIPRQPITIPSGSYGIWPMNLDCDGVTLRYATAQPLCCVVAERGIPVYFFAGLDGILPDLVFSGNVNHTTAVMGAEAVGSEVRAYDVGTNVSAFVVKTTGGAVGFVVLTPDQARHLWRASFAGRDRVIISKATVQTDGTSLRLQSDTAEDLAMSIFPPVPSVRVGGFPLAGSADSLFKRFAPGTVKQPVALDVAVSQEKPAGPAATSLKGAAEAIWTDAAVYKLNIPPGAAKRPMILDIHYIGDAARLYVGDKLFDDNFFNGDPFAIALSQIPADQWPDIRLKILPYSDAVAGRLPEAAKEEAAAAKAASTLDQVTATATDQLELQISPD